MARRVEYRTQVSHARLGRAIDPYGAGQRKARAQRLRRNSGELRRRQKKKKKKPRHFGSAAPQERAGVCAPRVYHKTWVFTRAPMNTTPTRDWLRACTRAHAPSFDLFSRLPCLACVGAGEDEGLHGGVEGHVVPDRSLAPQEQDRVARVHELDGPLVLHLTRKRETWARVRACMRPCVRESCMDVSCERASGRVACSERHMRGCTGWPSNIHLKRETYPSSLTRAV